MEADWAAQIARERKALSNYSGPLTTLFGDSNTHAPFQIFARNTNSNSGLIHDEGISGDTSSGILQRIKDMQVIRSSGRALLSGGTNDLKDLYINTRPRPGVAEVTGVIDRIIQNKRASIAQLREKNPNATISLVSIVPATGDRIPRSVVENANKRIAALAKEENVSLLDLTPSLTTNGVIRDDLRTDGLHFNGNGYDAIRKVLLQSYS